MNAAEDEPLVWRPSGLIYVSVLCRHVAAPDLPGAACQFLPLVRGPVTIQGSGTPGGSGPPREVRSSRFVRAERLLLPEHVVLLDLSQPGDGSGTVAE